MHSGNILYFEYLNDWYISDLGFCGNLPYIAPEFISGKEYIFASDVYSIGMFMWEISSEGPSFAGFDYDYDLAMKIINGIRPRKVPGTPLEYEKLMKRCWCADPSKRPDEDTLWDKIKEIYDLYLNENEQQTNNNINDYMQLDANVHTNSSFISSLARNFSKVHIFEGLPEPRNAAEGKVNYCIFIKIQKRFNSIELLKIG